MYIGDRYYIYYNILGDKSSIQARIFKFAITYIPPIRNKFKSEIEKTIISFNKDMTKLFDKKVYKIPNKKVSLDSLKERVFSICQRDE